MKHDGLTSRGEGACVTIPVRILPLPLVVDHNAKQADTSINLAHLSREETKEGSNSESVENTDVKLAIDSMS